MQANALIHYTKEDMHVLSRARHLATTTQELGEEFVRALISVGTIAKIKRIMIPLRT
jgi:hypothetical protein